MVSHCLIHIYLYRYYLASPQHAREYPGHPYNYRLILRHGIDTAVRCVEIVREEMLF